MLVCKITADAYELVYCLMTISWMESWLSHVTLMLNTSFKRTKMDLFWLDDDDDLDKSSLQQ